MAKLRITYTKSAIGYSQDQKDTVRSLGLRKLNSIVIQDDTPPIRGMLFKVRHLVTFEEVGDDASATPSAPIWKTTVRPASTSAARSSDAVPREASGKTMVLSETAEPEAEPETTRAGDASRKTVMLSTLDEPEAEPVPASAAASSADASRKTVMLSKLDEPEAEPETPRASDASRKTVMLSKPDDLEIIEGIGPKIAGILMQSGITTFAELAATSVARLEEILDAANLNLASPETWPEQAELAAAGDMDALKQLQDQLKGGRKE